MLTIFRLTRFRTFALGILTNPASDYIGWEKIPASMRSSLGSEALADLAKLPEDWPEVEYIASPGCKYDVL